MSRLRSVGPAYRHDRGRNCGTCDFWQPPSTDEEAIAEGARQRGWTETMAPGSCHRYAPSMPAGFPATVRRDWCGDYEAVADLIDAIDGDDR